MLQLIPGGFLKAVEDDTSPALGGDLDGGEFKGTFSTVNCTDEGDALQIDGVTVLKTGTAALVNIFFGVNSGISVTSGVRNVGVGKESLRYNNTGFNNFGLGVEALRQTTGGHDNIAIGAFAMRNNIGGDYNVAIGSQCLQNSNTIHNVGIGYYTLQKATGGKNTAIGGNAGSLLTTGASNVFIGYSAGFNQTTNSNLLIIDNQDRGSAANEATMALIYGLFAADPADQVLTLNASVFLPHVKAGTSQANAGAAAGELWTTLNAEPWPDGIVMIGL